MTKSVSSPRKRGQLRGRKICVYFLSFYFLFQISIVSQITFFDLVIKKIKIITIIALEIPKKLMCDCGLSRQDFQIFRHINFWVFILKMLLVCLRIRHLRLADDTHDGQCLGCGRLLVSKRMTLKRKREIGYNLNLIFFGCHLTCCFLALAVFSAAFC